MREVLRIQLKYLSVFCEVGAILYMLIKRNMMYNI